MSDPKTNEMTIRHKGDVSDIGCLIMLGIIVAGIILALAVGNGLRAISDSIRSHAVLTNMKENK